MLKNPLRLFALLLSVLFLSACEFTLAADITPPPGYQPAPEMPSTPVVTTGPLYPLLPPNSAGGRLTYVEKCAPCHGETGLGDGVQGSQLPNPVPALGSSEVARQASPAEWYRIVTQGNLERFMPPFGSLTDRQRWDVVAYAISLSVSESSLAQGKELYQDNCTECHGLDGKPVKTGLPDFTSQQAMAGKSTQDLYEVITNGAGDMAGFAEELTPDQRFSIAEYLRTFTFGFSTTAAAQPTPVATLAETETLTTTQELTPTVQITGTQTAGSITGLVINASGGAIPSELTVTLHGFDGMQMVYTDTTQTTETGAYLFSNVAMVPQRFYLTTVEFQDITYGSNVASVEEGQFSLELPLQVYESTRDSSILTVDRLHFFFEIGGGDVLRVVELYIISNPSSKTVIAGAQGEPVVTFTLPEGASNLEFQDGELGERYVTTADGFGDTQPVRPGIGSYQVMFSYELPYKRKLDLVRPATMATNAVVILVPEDGINIKGENIQDAGVRDVQGSPYHLYNGGSVSPGQEIRLTISSNVQLLPSGSSANLLVGLAALGLVMIGAGIWLYRRNQAAAIDNEDLEEEHDGVAEETSSSETPEALMDAILALDDLHQAGELPEDAYIQRRQELRARLKELLSKQE